MLVLFFIYTTQNKAHIQEQNRIYAEDCARQTAERIESEFNNARQRICNNAYLVSTNGNDSEIDARMIKGMEYNTIQYNTIQYNTIQYNTILPLLLFALSMRMALILHPMEEPTTVRTGIIFPAECGASGLETVAESRLTGKTMMVFCASVYREQKIAGMFLGLYFAEDYLRDMIMSLYRHFKKNHAGNGKQGKYGRSDIGQLDDTYVCRGGRRCGCNDHHASRLRSKEFSSVVLQYMKSI